MTPKRAMSYYYRAAENGLEVITGRGIYFQTGKKDGKA